MYLKTERLLIRRFILEDQDDLFELLSDRQTCYDIEGYEPFDEMDEEFYRLMQNFSKDENRYVIELMSEQKVIGSIRLMEEERAVLCYEIGYLIHPNYRRLGYAYEAI